MLLLFDTQFQKLWSRTWGTRALAMHRMKQVAQLSQRPGDFGWRF